MMCTVFWGMLIVTAISITFFYAFLDDSLHKFVENVYIAQTFIIMKDIIQVRKNDFMLLQQELQISASFFQDIIDRNFNIESLLGPPPYNLDRFWRYSDSMYTY